MKLRFFIIVLVCMILNVGFVYDKVNAQTDKPLEQFEYLEYNRLLKLNTKGKDVLQLNYVLDYLGYNTNPNKEIFDITTKNAVLEFQINNKLLADGKVGKQTINKLNTLLEQKYKSESDLRKLEYRRLLKKGVQGEDVYVLSFSLNLLGYNLDITSTYDNQIQSVVKDFQKKNHISADGLAGRETINAINDQLRKHLISIPEVSVFSLYYDIKDHWILINTSSNYLYLMKDNDMIGKYNISTNNPINGKFEIITKTINPPFVNGSSIISGGSVDNPLGSRWLGINEGGGELYGIHGTSSSVNTNDFIKSSCVKLKNTDLEYIYSLLPVGSIVWIGDEQQISDWGFCYTLID